MIQGTIHSQSYSFSQGSIYRLNSFRQYFLFFSRFQGLSSEFQVSHYQIHFKNINKFEKETIQLNLGIFKK